MYQAIKHLSKLRQYRAFKSMKGNLILVPNMSFSKKHRIAKIGGLIKDANSGFTLVELLVAVAIFATISIVAVQTLYDSLSIRARQQAIEDSTDGFRILAKLITKSVMEAQSIFIPNPHEIQIATTTSCHTIKYDPDTGFILHSAVWEIPCTPPHVGFSNITADDLVITDFSFSPVGTSVKAVTFQMEGLYKNSMDIHPLKYKTTITQRI